MRYLIFICLSFWTFSTVFAQCFENTRARGLRSFEQKNYFQAVNEYFAAMDCVDCPDKEDHDLEELIKQAQMANDQLLRQRVTDSQQALKLAQDAQNNEKKAKELAQKNAKTAELNGKRAETLRLTLLADIERRRRNFQDALPLAFLAIQLSDLTNHEDAFRCFARTVRDSFTQEVPVSGKLFLLDNSPAGLSFIDDNGLTLLKNGNLNSKIQLQGVRKLFYADENIIIGDKGEKGEIIVNAHGKADSSKVFKGHSEAVNWVGVNHGFLLSGSRDNTVVIWDRSGNKKAVLKGHLGNVYEGAMAGNEKHIITRSSDGTVRIGDVEGNDLEVIATDSPYVHCMDVDQERQLILIGNANGEISVWNLEGVKQFSISHGKKAVKEVFFVGKDNSKFISYSIDNSAKLCNDKGEIIKTFDAVEEVAYLSDLDLIYTINNDSGITFWTVDGEKRTSISDLVGSISHFDYNSIYKWFLTVNRNGSIKILDENFRMVLDHEIPENPHIQTSFSFNGEFFSCYNRETGNVEIVPLPHIIFGQVEESISLKPGIKFSLISKYQIQFLD